MRNSNYYYRLMTNYKNKKKEAQEEKKIYDDILPKIKILKNELPTAKSDLVNAERNFKSGGFLSDGETYDKGELKKCYDMLDDDINSLKAIQAKIEVKIDELKNEITKHQYSYDSAYRQYRRAREEERER